MSAPTPPDRPPLVVCYAGGGAFGLAWHLGVTDAIRDAGWDLDSAPLIGTSAGAWASVAARLRVGADQFIDAGPLRLWDPRPGILADYAARLFGADTRVHDVWIAVVELPTMRRRLLSGADHPVHDLVAASSAVPGVFAPHRVGGRLYIDGGVRSMSSADLAPQAETLAISLPIAGTFPGPAGRALEATAERLARRWESRGGGTAVILRPPANVTSQVGLGPRALFDTTLAVTLHPACADAATEAVRATRQLALRA